MIQNVLRHLGGIENYGIVSLCLFFFVFSGTVAWALFLSRKHLVRMAELPLENETEPSTNRKESR